MRLAIISDIHGNRTAFEAILADLRETSPDLILHGGDLADGGSSPIEIVDWIRDLGWQGVVGNTDEMLFRPESLAEFAGQAPQFAKLFAAIEKMAGATREMLGAERLRWLSGMPMVQKCGPVALVHASPESSWRAPSPEAAATELQSTYGPLAPPIVVYGHIHRPYIRSVSGMIVANSGSVGFTFDGDRRAAYLVVDDAEPKIRRVEYDVDREIKALLQSGLPHADWVAKTLASGTFQMP